jgi:5'-nucleotidase
MQTSKDKPLILISNDDGITAPGIRALVEVMKEIGDVLVVAPDKPQSAMGHAITINQPLRLTKVEQFPGVEAYQCTGTPVDCVKLAIDKLLNRKPDLMVSGINHGSNSSINVIYSGTMSAAVEAAIDGMPAIGFSLCDYSWDANFEVVKPFIRRIALEYLRNGLPYGTLLNVNLPVPEGGIKGIKVCRQAVAKWKEDFDERLDPFNRKYYWMTGRFVNMDKGEDTDEWALAQGYVSVVPTQFDLTDHSRISALNTWDLHE